MTLTMNIKMYKEKKFTSWIIIDNKTTKLRHAFENNMSTNVKFSKTQISKIVQFGWFLGLSLSKRAGPLMKVAVMLAKKLF